jgi:hypothetical protein
MLAKDTTIMTSIVGQLDEKDKAVKSVMNSIPKKETESKKKVEKEKEPSEFE